MIHLCEQHELWISPTTVDDIVDIIFRFFHNIGSFIHHIDILDISHQQFTAKPWGPMNCSSSVAKNLGRRFNDPTGRRKKIDDGDVLNVPHLESLLKIGI